MCTAVRMTLQQRQSRTCMDRVCVCVCVCNVCSVFIPAAWTHIIALIKTLCLHMRWSEISCQVPAGWDVFTVRRREQKLLRDRLKAPTQSHLLTSCLSVIVVVARNNCCLILCNVRNGLYGYECWTNSNVFKANHSYILEMIHRIHWHLIQ